MKTAKYVLWRGMEKVEVEADSVAVILDDGTEFELRFRKSDGEVSLGVDHTGKLLIEPRASNMFRLSVRK